MTTRCVCYVAVGDNYINRLHYSISSLRAVWSGKVVVITDYITPILTRLSTTYDLHVLQFAVSDNFSWQPTAAYTWSPNSTQGLRARVLKTQVMALCPYEQVLFLDVDTLILKPLDSLWQLLTSDTDIVIGPAQFHSSIADARDMRLFRIGDSRFRADWALSASIAGTGFPFYSSSTMLWRSSATTLALANAWYVEWQRYQQSDMLPLARALATVKPAITQLPAKYNVRYRYRQSTVIYTTRIERMARDYKKFVANKTIKAPIREITVSNAASSDSRLQQSLADKFERAKGLRVLAPTIASSRLHTFSKINMLTPLSVLIRTRRKHRRHAGLTQTSLMQLRAQLLRKR